jgi:hypothetical protein
MDSLRRCGRFVHCVAHHGVCPQGLGYVYWIPWATFAGARQAPRRGTYSKLSLWFVRALGCLLLYGEGEVG